MAALVWLPEAKDDIQRLFEFIEPHSANAAVRAIDALIEAAEGLRSFPQKGRPWPPSPEFRELFVIFGAKGYVIRYREFDDKIVIVRVWHALEDR